jgi:hypothetical protein
MKKKDAQDERIKVILGEDAHRDFDEAVGVFYEYLKSHLSLPCQVTGIEDFNWEEPYVFGARSKEEYDKLRKTRPSFQDRYTLLEILRHGFSEWMLFSDEDLVAHVRRLSDGKEFWLGLAELRATDRKSPNRQLLDDYSVWLVNNR